MGKARETSESSDRRGFRRQIVTVDGDFSLVGCTVAPGFDFADFEMADRESLLHLFPLHGELIRRLTR